MANMVFEQGSNVDLLEEIIKEVRACASVMRREKMELRYDVMGGYRMQNEKKKGDKIPEKCEQTKRKNTWRGRKKSEGKKSVDRRRRKVVHSVRGHKSCVWYSEPERAYERVEEKMSRGAVGLTNWVSIQGATLMRCEPPGNEIKILD